jgi:hypothetical protein
LGRGPNKAEREAAFQKLQSKWGAKNLERDEEERQERKQIRQEEREDRKREGEKARSQEERAP